MPSRRRRRNILYAILVAALLAVFVASLQAFSSATSPPDKPLSELLTALEQKQVASGTFDSTDEGVDWTDNHGQRARTFYPTGYEAVLVDKFQEDHVRFGARSSGSNLWLTVVLPNVILFLVIGGFMWYVLRRFSGKHPAAT
jgi:ATP-dependent Zn protease